MPHIIIKAVEGATDAQKQKACEAAIQAVSDALGKDKRFFSAAVEDYSFEEWEVVYHADIKDNAAVVVKPGYTNPKTFE